MALIRALMHFGVRELWTRRELLGTSCEFEREGRLVRITFPRDKDDFELGVHRDEFADRAIKTTGAFGEDPIEKVLILQVEVEGPADFDATDFPPAGEDTDPPKQTAVEAASLFLDESLALAQAALNDFLAWTKLKLDQRWLGLTGEVPALFAARLFDLDADGQRIRFGVERLLLQHRSEESALTVDVVAELAPRLAAGDRPGLADEFLLDAEHFTWRGDVTDLRRAVLLAAIACEVKAKEMLEEKASTDAGALLSAVLAGARSGVNFRTLALFDSLAISVVGRSLRDDDRPLFNRVEKLFELRNQVAHRGHAPERAAAWDAVAAARQAFDWLNGL